MQGLVKHDQLPTFKQMPQSLSDLYEKAIQGIAQNWVRENRAAARDECFDCMRKIFTNAGKGERRFRRVSVNNVFWRRLIFCCRVLSLGGDLVVIRSVLYFPSQPTERCK